MNHYGTLRSIQYFKENRSVSYFHLIIKPPARFFIHLFIRGGFLDGFQGFVFAKAQAYGVYVKYLKLWLLKKENKRNI